MKHDRFCDFNDVISPQEKKLSFINKEDSIRLYQGDFIRNDSEHMETYSYGNLNNGTIVINEVDKKTKIRKALVYKNQKLVGSFFLYVVGNLIIGKEIEYDDKGKVAKLTDHSQNDKYPICFKEAIKIIERKISKQDTILGIDRAKKIREKDTLYYWNITVEQPPKTASRRLWVYDVDAATGLILKKRSARPSKSHFLNN